MHNLPPGFILIVSIGHPFFLALLFCQLSYSVSGSEICEPTDDLGMCYKRILSFEAIGEIHRYIDGDKNGEVDSSETATFLRQEFSLSERVQKPRLLSHDDPFISLTDLWRIWRNNPAFNWTVHDTIQWLSESVSLPQYDAIFLRHTVDGLSIPRLALQNMSYISETLGIRNPIHKKKIMLKALDTVLFGPVRRPPIVSRQIPLFTVSLGILMIGILGYFHWIYRNSSTKSQDFDSKGLLPSELALTQLHKKLREVDYLSHNLNSCELKAFLTSSTILQSSFSSSNESEISVLDLVASAAFHKGRLSIQNQSQEGHFKCLCESEENTSPDVSGTSHYLRHANANPDRPSSVSLQNSVNSNSPSNVTETPNELNLWLQLSYELEVQSYLEKKRATEHELKVAHEAFDRINRKRYTIMGIVRLVHSDSLADLERRLLIAKSALEHLRESVEECSYRWSRIETLSGFQIRKNAGVTNILSNLSQNSGIKFPASTRQEVVNTHLRNSSSTDLFELTSHCNTDTSRMVTSPRSDSSLSESRFNAGSTPKINGDVRNTETKGAIPRNYSFVRPFAAIWRRKAKSTKKSNCPTFTNNTVHPKSE